MSDIDPLRQQLAEMLNRQQLDEQQFARLQRKLAPPRAVRTGWRAKLAAAACISLLVVPPFFVQHHQSAPFSQVGERISEEVLTNHTRIYLLDIQTDSFAQLHAKLNRIDFALQETAPEEITVTLQGARYCTLQGVLATQLIYQTAKGQRLTQYQTHYDPERFGPLPASRSQAWQTRSQASAISIRIWQQNGVLIAEAVPQTDELTSGNFKSGISLDITAYLEVAALFPAPTQLADARYQKPQSAALQASQTPAYSAAR